jgi:hypothetical protein
MNMKKVVIELSANAVQKILRIDMDGDASEALTFIKEKLAKQVKGALRPH